MTGQKIYSVSQLNRYIKGLMENDLILNGFWVKGEISNYKLHSSGHIYFTLKDSSATINAVMFKDMASLMPYELENGLEVVVCGYVSVYEKTGVYQVYAQIISPVGAGELSLKFEQLKSKLLKEGLFDDDFKREIPEKTQNITVITSPTGAAVRDIINVATRRNPSIKITIIPTTVQGEYAVDSIVRGIKTANEWGKADVIILGRGGGSIEDLWAFNDEKVARAIFASEIPIISAVGHETDFTISDFVADLRAATPSAAAELATNDLLSDINYANKLAETISANLIQKYNYYKNSFNNMITRPVLKKPLGLINDHMMYVENVTQRLNANINHQTQMKTNDFAKQLEKLEALSPLGVLKRGYSVATHANGKVITSSEDIKCGDIINIETKNSIINAKVEGWLDKNG